MGNSVISVIGLGYVGLPLAKAFAQVKHVIGFDINEDKIIDLINGIDVIGDDDSKTFEQMNVFYTSDEKELQNALFHIVAVPTPINEDKTPNYRPLIHASELLGRNLQKSSIVVYESTVYPGATEGICIPVLEKESGLVCGKDFWVGYSPERINPGDKKHGVKDIIKIVAGMDENTLETIAVTYEEIIEAGVYRVSSIKIAEAAKVIENTQRDINIAFMNELSMIFNRLGIDTDEVLKAAGTKWNFLKFSPGLVGGHCIGVDPYYLAYKARQLGYHPEVIMSGRRINDNMGKYVAEHTVKTMVRAGIAIWGSKVLIMGFTFKENVNDARNTKVIDIIHELNEFGVDSMVTDPLANPKEVYQEYGIELVSSYHEVSGVDAIILAVNHDAYKEITLHDLLNKYHDGHHILIDVKAFYDKSEAKRLGYLYWRL